MRPLFHAYYRLSSSKRDAPPGEIWVVASSMAQALTKIEEALPGAIVRSIETRGEALVA